MLTRPRRPHCFCCEAANATCTERVDEVPRITVSPLPARAPSWADTEVTRTATGSNTTWPDVRRAVPAWTPLAAWSRITAAVVSGRRRRTRIKLSRGDVADATRFALSSPRQAPSPRRTGFG